MVMACEELVVSFTVFGLGLGVLSSWIAGVPIISPWC